MRPQKFRGNVFVANLPKGFTDEQLAQAFDPFGLVLGAYIARDAETGSLKGHGLVSIAPERAANEAVAALHGMEIDGRNIQVRLADPNMALTIPKPPRPAAPPREAIVERRPAFQVEFRSLPRRTYIE